MAPTDVIAPCHEYSGFRHVPQAALSGNVPEGADPEKGEICALHRSAVNEGSLDDRFWPDPEATAAIRHGSYRSKSRRAGRDAPRRSLTLKKHRRPDFAVAHNTPSGPS
jgi:hypothetical protein